VHATPAPLYADAFEGLESLLFAFAHTHLHSDRIARPEVRDIRPQSFMLNRR
jgi:hypothetical protein